MLDCVLKSTAGQITVNVSDRASASGTFGAPSSVVVAAADTRVAIAPDALRVVFVKSDGRSFGVLTRDIREGAFAPGDAAEFSTLNDVVPLEDGGDPVLDGAQIAEGGRPQGLHRPPEFVGVLASAQGAGAIAGGPAMYEKPVGRRFDQEAPEKRQEADMLLDPASRLGDDDIYMR